MGTEPGQRGGNTFAERRGGHAEGTGEFAAIDDEGALELIHHFDDFARAGDENSGKAHHEGIDGADFGRLLRGLENLRNQIALGDGWRARDVPDLTERFVTFSEDRHRFADIERIGKSVGRVEVAHARGGFACQRGIENLVGIEHIAGAIVIRGADGGSADFAAAVGICDLDPPQDQARNLPSVRL